MTTLTEEFGYEVRARIAAVYPLQIMTTVLFDLLIKSHGEQFATKELVEHVDATMVDDLGLSSERCNALYSEPMPQVLTEIYRILHEIVWPHLVDHASRRLTACVQRANYEVLEISFTRVEALNGA